MLAATRIGADTAQKTLVLLHGIYGRGRNWQSIARGIVAARPDYACWLVDLPYHGDSAPADHGDTIAAMARHVHEWMAERQVVPTAVLGHSYGGKVALSIAERAPELPLEVWVIDSTPEVKPPSGSAWAMLDVVRRLPSSFDSRDAAIAALVENGYTLGVAQWMATNLAREGNALRWRLDFDAMERLLLDFFATDMWHVVEHPAAGHRIHVLKASESNAITPAAVARLEAATNDRVWLHHRPGGHWIHAESPALVTELLLQYLP
jgi:esterase